MPVLIICQISCLGGGHRFEFPNWILSGIGLSNRPAATTTGSIECWKFYQIIDRMPSNYIDHIDRINWVSKCSQMLSVTPFLHSLIISDVVELKISWGRCWKGTSCFRGSSARGAWTSCTPGATLNPLWRNLWKQETGKAAFPVDWNTTWYLVHLHCVIFVIFCNILCNICNIL